MYHSHIHEYAKCTWDVHYIYNIEHRISKFEKHVTTSQFRYEPFYYLWVERFFDIRREAQSFYFGFFICPTRVAPATKVSASKRKSTVSFGVQCSTHWLFQNFPKSSARFRCVTSFALASLRFPSRAIVTSLSDTSTLRARAWTPASMLHLSNPCTEPKCSQPN